MDDLRSKIEQALATRGDCGKVLRASAAHHFGTLVGESPQMLQVYTLVAKAAKCDLPVLILGESGTGKELVAAAIHRSSARRDGPWTAMNCAAISPLLLESEMFGHAPGAFTGASQEHDGIFIAAHGGTLFLDEIGTLKPELQSKLLRALEEGQVRRVGENTPVEVDVRMLTATNRDLQSLVEAGTFRRDLMYRLHVIEISLPPLREREGYVELLASAFCLDEEEKQGKPIHYGEQTAKLLTTYDWPGNVRELRNAIACAAVLSGQDGEIGQEDLPPRIVQRSKDLLEKDRITRHRKAGDSLEDYLRTVEKEYVDRVVERTGGNRSEAASILGISRATFYRKYCD
jgi:transcriptional regulator with PAS, ATPase and Fis domain